MTETQTMKTQSDLDSAFKYLTEIANDPKMGGTAAHLRMTGHIRAVTGVSANIAMYKAPTFRKKDGTAPTIDEKWAMMRLLFNAIRNKDYSILQGQPGNGDKKADVQPEVKRVDPMEEVKGHAPKVEPEDLDEDEKQPKREVKPRIETPKNHTDDLAAIIADRLRGLVKAEGVDEGAVRSIVGERMTEWALDYEKELHDKVTKIVGNGGFPVDRVKKLISDSLEGLVTRVIITSPTGETKEVGRQHYKFPLLMACLSQRLNVALVGPAGSGKTTGAAASAEALNLKHGAMSVGPMTSKSDLLGFKTATGEYHESMLVNLATNGGVALVDEWDAANAGVATYTNMITANEEFGTPDGKMRKKHKDFCLIAGMNTYGMGANRVYVGRNQLDGATLDRFVVIDWDYDEGFEASIVGVTHKSPVLNLGAGGIMQPDEWFNYVVSVRKACEKLAIRHVVSPRATIYGTKLFAAGVGRDHVEGMVLWKGIEKATVDKVKGAL